MDIQERLTNIFLELKDTQLLDETDWNLHSFIFKICVKVQRRLNCRCLLSIEVRIKPYKHLDSIFNVEEMRQCTAKISYELLECNETIESVRLYIRPTTHE